MDGEYFRRFTRFAMAVGNLDELERESHLINPDWKDTYEKRVQELKDEVLQQARWYIHMRSRS